MLYTSDILIYRKPIVSFFADHFFVANTCKPSKIPRAFKNVSKVSVSRVASLEHFGHLTAIQSEKVERFRPFDEILSISGSSTEDLFLELLQDHNHRNELSE